MTTSYAAFHTLSDLPCAHWVLDDNSPFKDYSGHNKTATATGFTAHPALVSGAEKSIVVDGSSRLESTANVFGRGHERLPFSIEVTFRSIKKDWQDTSPQQVWGHAGAYDGILIAGTTVSFTTKYENGTDATCSYDIGSNRAVTVVGVHTEAKNSLYVDGELVSEVDITPEQQADLYATDGYEFSSGDTTGANKLALNSISAYRSAIPAASVERHYESKTSGMSLYDVAISQGGAIADFSVASVGPTETIRFDSTLGFSSGYFSGTSVADGEIVPLVEDGVVVPSYWEVGVPLPVYLDTVYGVTLRWSGNGASVHTSLDDEQWSEAVYAVRVDSVPAGTPTNGRMLVVRVSFSNTSPPDSYLDELVVDIFGNNQVAPLLGRELSLSNASPEEDHSLISYDENWGLELNSGQLTIGAKPEDAPDIKTIELWMKKRDSQLFADNIYSAASKSRTNGGAMVPYQPDEWQLRTYVFDDGISEPIELRGTGQIGAVVAYDYAMTNAQIKSSYKRYMNVERNRLSSGGSIEMSDLVNDVEIYEYEWAVVEAG